MEYKYYLPDKNNQAKEYVTENNSLIIIGSNGAGKTKLGEWMEMNLSKYTHRIGAQRSLVFGDYIQQKSYEQAINLLVYGNEKEKDNHNLRWWYDGEKYNYTSGILNDYEKVLSALIALKNCQQEQYIAECKDLDAKNEPHNKVPEMVTDVLLRIWKSVFPQRNIKLDDAKVTAIYSKDDTKKEYKGIYMSDGERVALYLIAQALCVPKNKTIIIDEPEIHLHRSIMNRLWVAIEKERQDCFFVYITHDTQFAATHNYADKIWVKGYDGERWNLEKIKDSGLPEELLLNILGNRNPVLFVEGTADSYDTKLYSEIYKNYYVVPCGSCSSVIAKTKAMRANSQLHHLKCYGIIDRDYRNEKEIKKLNEDGIYLLKVAEVENLFLVEELLEVVNKIMGFNDTSNISKLKEYIVKKRFQLEIYHQITYAIISELKYQLSTMNITGENEEEVKQSLETAYKSIDFDKIKAEKEDLFNKALANDNNYAQVLKIFNRKDMSKSVGRFFDIKNDEYKNFIVRQLNSDYGDQIKNAIIKYLPKEILEENNKLE